MYNSGINKDTRYFVLIYENGEIIEEHVIIGQDNAYNYGESRVKELGYGDYKVKVD
ncbi:MAG: hypothetical protein IKO36_03175 [Bacteroidaceae bacterium]|nr:hypothetical protein [Bacteroidaceae bacterium]